MRRISAHRVFTPNGFLERGVVSVGDDGEILGIEVFDSLDSQAGVEFYSGTLIPGLVNAHCHLELSHLRGLIPSEVGFEGFVAAMKSAPRTGGAKAAGFWNDKMWAEGVQAVADICNGTSTFELKKISSVCYHSFREVFGFSATIPADTYNITPHSLYSLTPEMFSASVLHSSFFTLHFRESEYEVENPAETLVERVPKDKKVMLVHNCLITQRDIDIIMEHFVAPPTWVVCARSNRYISGLRPPIELLRKNHLDIAIGTDSLASNEVLSMAAEMAEFADIPTEEVLSWATINGARALGLDHTLGSIEVGRRPGLAILSGGNIKRIL